MNEEVENEKLRMQIKKQCFWFTLISLVNEEAAGAWYSAVLMSVCVLPPETASYGGGMSNWEKDAAGGRAAEGSSIDRSS